MASRDFGFLGRNELRLEVAAPRREVRHLPFETRQAREQGLMARAARLDANRRLARGIARPIRPLPRVRQRLPQHVPFGFERAALLLEIGHAADGLLEPRARGAIARVGHLERALELGELRRELLHARIALLGAGPQPVELRAQVHVRRAATRQLALPVGDAILGLADPAPHVFELVVERAATRLQPIEFRPLAAQFLLALDDALVGISIAADAQPVRADPEAVLRDHRLSGAQLRPHRERFGQRVRRDDAFEQRVEPGGPLHARAQAATDVPAASRALGAGKEGHRARREALEHPRHVVDRIDADGLEIRAEHGFDRALPAGVHRQLAREARAFVEAARLEPVDDLALALAERSALQRLERDDASLDVLQLPPCEPRGFGELPLASALGLQRCDEFRHARPNGFERREGLGLRALDVAERRSDVGCGEVAVLLRRALALRDQPAQLVVHFLETRPLGFRRGRRAAQRLVESLPALLPLVHRGLRRDELDGRGLLGRPRRLEAGLELRERGLQFGRLRGITHAVGLGFLQALADLLEFLPLAAADLARVLDRLLVARDLRAHLVVAALHLGEHLGSRVVLVPRTLDGRLVRALLGQRGLQREVALVQDRLARTGLAFDLAQPERQQLRLQLPLVLLQRLVTPRSRGLPLQVAQLLLDLVAQVGEPRQVLAGVRNAGLGLAAALLVARDAGRLLEERAHLVGLGLDHARDHVLLDDRVTARAQAGAQEQLGDVLAPAADAVQEIRRGTVARDDALQRDFRVARVLAAELAVGVVEHQFDGRVAHGLARARAVEDDVRHRFAAQVLRRDLAHDPAHGVDDVRLAAAVGADHADQVAREIDAGRVHEGLESGQLDLGQAHRSPRLGGGGRKRGV